MKSPGKEQIPRAPSSVGSPSWPVSPTPLLWVVLGHGPSFEGETKSVKNQSADLWQTGKLSLSQRGIPGQSSAQPSLRMGLGCIPSWAVGKEPGRAGQGDVAARGPDRPPRAAEGTRARSGQRKKQRR